MKSYLPAILLVPVVFVIGLFPASAVDPDVLKAEKERLAVVAKVRPAVVAVCPYGGGGHGSGVIIDPEGYALTNFHVTADVSPVMSAGLADGILYDAVLVGQDKVGDVALIKLLPKKEGTPFPYVQMGDSDLVKAGDWSLAMGNPFGLSTDFTPTVTYGLVSGVNRYQPPAGGGTLEYTDCIQIDTSINPGNSGGPLFNMKGELIGINGRGSFDKRGRVNSGVGYAISINQIKNFLGHFKAGIDTDHATLGATIETENEEGSLSEMKFGTILEEADVYRRGIKPGDKLIAFAGRPMTSTNQYKNILGIFPKEWRLPLSYRRDNTRKETLVRLMGNMDTPVESNQPKPQRPPQPGGPDPTQDKAKRSPAMKLFKAKKGYANWYFNEIEQKRLLTAFHKHGDFSNLTGAWTLEGTFNANDRKGPLALTISDGSDGTTDAKLMMNVPFAIKMPTAERLQLQLPDNSGGLLAALTHYRRLLILGEKGFSQEFSHGGTEPVYPSPTDGRPVEDWSKLRVDCEVIRANYAGIEGKWYFDKRDAKLIAAEVQVLRDEDPCELYFSDYKPWDGRLLPHRIDIRWGDRNYGSLTFTKFDLKK